MKKRVNTNQNVMCPTSVSVHIHKVDLELKHAKLHMILQ